MSATVAAMALALTARGAAADAALDSLVANERAFSAMSVAEGMNKAFLTYLAEDAVVFNPTATNGRKLWESRPPLKSLLIWEPEFAEVASSGDLGYTTGPWELRPPADTTRTQAASDSTGAPAAADSVRPSAPPRPTVYGHFNSVWKKRKGVWRVAVDMGGGHAKPERGGVGNVTLEEGPVLPRRTMKSGRVDLRDADRGLSNAMRKVGAEAAIEAFATTDFRLNTEGRLPARGIPSAQARFDSLAGFFEFEPQGTGVSSAGDLGFTYGLAKRFATSNTAAADTSAYLHVWRQEDGRTWKLALAVLNPLKP